MTTTLTERYITATVKTLPPATQGAVRAELKASIADAVEARVEQGEERGAAERTALTGLGDPASLAAGYADRPLHLIGPRYYLTWWRLLKPLLIIVPACTVGAVALGQTLANAPVGAIIGQSIAAGLSVVVHLFFWTTLVFVVLERTGADTGVHWTVDQLPEPTPAGTGRAGLIASLVFLGVAAGTILWGQFRGFVYLPDRTLPILAPGLWPWAIAALLALIGLEAALAVVVYVRGRWTTALAVVNTMLAVLFVSWAMALLGRGLLVNPALVDVLLQNDVGPEVVRILGVLLGFGIVGVAVWDIVDGWLKRRRDVRRTVASTNRDEGRS